METNSPQRPNKRSPTLSASRSTSSDQTLRLLEPIETLPFQEPSERAGNKLEVKASRFYWFRLSSNRPNGWLKRCRDRNRTRNDGLCANNLVEHLAFQVSRRHSALALVPQLILRAGRHQAFCRCHILPSVRAPVMVCKSVEITTPTQEP